MLRDIKEHHGDIEDDGFPKAYTHFFEIEVFLKLLLFIYFFNINAYIMYITEWLHRLDVYSVGNERGQEIYKDVQIPHPLF